MRPRQSGALQARARVCLHDKVSLLLSQTTVLIRRIVSARLALGIFYAFAVFLGAFLLFAVQPLIARFVLPWFGGTPAVWTTCMLFFQVLLLLGYAYASVLARGLTPRAQVVIHIMLLVVALCMLPIVPREALKPLTPEQPIGKLLAILLVSVGVPYFMLSATSPLLQAWYAESRRGESPYHLYALSNAGSLLALVAYPFVLEPMMTRGRQAQLWGWGLAVFAVLCSGCAIGFARTAGAARPIDEEPKDDGVKSGAGTAALWIALSACPSLLLLATTNKICQEVAVVPLLWILPLSLYLLSFILCFARRRFYLRRLWMPLLALSLLAICAMLWKPTSFGVRTQIALYCATLFVSCMVCHGELARLKPGDTRKLTLYYLFISIGGAIGGAFVSLAAPVLFEGYYELQGGLALCAALAMWVLLVDPASKLFRGARPLAWASILMLFVGVAYVLYRSCIVVGAGDRLAAVRNFYGILIMEAQGGPEPETRFLLMYHGNTIHGVQFTDPSRSRLPTSYYTPMGGGGIAMEHLFPDPTVPRRIGLIGLGAGTMATYGRPGDVLRFYEINPAVIEMARTRFTFLSESRAQTETVLGDGRLALEAEPAQDFDLLVLDAFAGDTTPVHLMTSQAMDVYARHLKPSGVIAAHISNRSLDLRPVMARLAAERQWAIAWIRDTSNPDRTINTNSDWVLMSPDRERLSIPFISSVSTPLPLEMRNFPLWTDDYTSIFTLYR